MGCHSRLLTARSQEKQDKDVRGSNKACARVRGAASDFAVWLAQPYNEPWMQDGQDNHADLEFGLPHDGDGKLRWTWSFLTVMTKKALARRKSCATRSFTMNDNVFSRHLLTEVLVIRSPCLH